MKNWIGSALTACALAAAVFSVVTLTTPTAQAVGCPPPSGPVTGIACGGFAGLECPGNLVCIDDPRDNCCPQTGGADCIGVCVRRGR